MQITKKVTVKDATTATTAIKVKKKKTCTETKQ